jgi:hypothetical protein
VFKSFVILALGIGGAQFARDYAVAYGTPACTNAALADTATRGRDLLTERDSSGRPRLDLSRPVPSKSEVLRAWQARQDAIHSFRFAWTEDRCFAKGWLPNPRHPERERLDVPGLRVDRGYTVRKTLVVDGGMMRYTYEMDRMAEADGIRVVVPGSDNRGLGLARHYTYVSVFDGQRGETRLTALRNDEAPVIRPSAAPVDAQNLDTRAIMLAFRPLDRIMGSRHIDRAVTNLRRTFRQGRSTFLVEESHDPSGWKMILVVEPERDFLIVRIALAFEQTIMVDIEIDHKQDARWGWIPAGWRVIAVQADGSRRQVSTATVTSYAINEPIPVREFR